MAEFPAMPLWTDAYLGDTRHLTTFEHGAYLLLLIVAWRSPDGALPDDDMRLARYAGCTRAQWRRIAPTIRAFFRQENGQLVQSRLNDERKAVRQKRESQAANGRASALKRKERHSTKREPSVNPHTLTPSVSKDTGQNARQEDPVKQLFDFGIGVLIEGGRSEKDARSLIGKWRKGGRDGEVMAALMECRARGIAEPVEWLEKRLSRPAYVSKTGFEYKGSLEQIAKQAHDRADWGTYWTVKRDMKEAAHG